MSNNHSNEYFVELGDDGKYRGTRGGAERAGYVGTTQHEVINQIQQAHPDATIHVERVRDTSAGNPDKWRKP